MRIVAEVITGILIAALFFEIGYKISTRVTFLYLDEILRGEGLNTRAMLEKYKTRFP